VQKLKTKNQTGKGENANIVLCPSGLTLKTFLTFDLDFCILAFHFYISMKSQSPKTLQLLTIDLRLLTAFASSAVF